MSEKNNLKATSDVADFTGQLKQQAAEAAKALETLIARQKDLELNGKQNSKSFQDIASKVRLAKEALEETTKQIDANVRALKESKNSLEQNQGLLLALKAKHDQLSKSKGEDSKETKSLEKQIDALTKTVSKQEKALEKSKEKLDFYALSKKALKGATDELSKSNKDFAPVLSDVTNGFNMMKNGLGYVKTGFKTVDGAIKTTGFGLLLLVLQSVVDYFTKTKEGAEKLAGIISAVGLVIKTVKDTVSNVLSSIGKNIVNALSNPAETVKKVWNGVIDNFKSRVEGIFVFARGIQDNFNLKKMGDGLIQMGTGVTNATNKIAGAIKQTKNAAIEAGDAITKAYNDGVTTKRKQDDDEKKTEDSLLEQQKKKEERDRKNLLIAQKKQQADKEELDNVARLTAAVFDQHAKEITDTEAHFKALEKKFKGSKDKLIQIETDKAAAFENIRKKFQADDQDKLDGYMRQLEQIAIDNTTDVKEKALKQLELDSKDKLDAMTAEDVKIKQKIAQHQEEIKLLRSKGKLDEIKILEASIKLEEEILKKSFEVQEAFRDEKRKKENEINSPKSDVAAPSTPKEEDAKDDNKSQQAIDEAEQSGHHSKALKLQIDLLKQQHDIAVAAAVRQGQDTTKIQEEYNKKKTALEDKLTLSKIHAGDKFLDAAMKGSKKDSAIFKAAFMAKKAIAIADTIISTKTAVMDSLTAYSSIPFIGQALGIVQAAFMAAQGASSIAEIAKQKPGFAAGGQFHSDGRGALLPGYSRTDNTNAYLRSGEAVVVSEAMRNPWARNLVSAINVAHGGRDFSIANPGRGYAIGGIFTDGGNSNRYYSQPLNDQKDLANTIAYQMVNNFPPVYVDVKDINNQQNILARTVDRVNL